MNNSASCRDKNLVQNVDEGGNNVTEVPKDSWVEVSTVVYRIHLVRPNYLPLGRTTTSFT